MTSMPDIEEARQSGSCLADLLRRDREAMADFVAALAEFNRRRLWIPLGFNCLFNYLHHGLRMSRSASHYRRVAAELAETFPEIIEPLRDGRLCLSVVSELAKVLTERNRDVLERFFWISADTAKEIVAELNPKLDPPRREVVTVVAASAPRSAAALAPNRSDGLPAGVLSGLDLTSPIVEGATASPLAVVAATTGDAAVVPLSPSGDCATSSGSPRESNRPPEIARPASKPGEVTEMWIEPLGRQLYRIHVTVTQSFMDKIDAARDALASKKVRCKAEVLEAALDLVLEQQAKRRAQTTRPQRNPRPSDDPVHIPANVKRAVGKRDGWRCQFPTESGGVCGSKRNIQFDHIVPSTRGGPSTVANLRCLCAMHNAVAARLALGDPVVDRYTRRGRRGSAADDVAPPKPARRAG